MRTFLIAAASLGLALALPLTASAQGRHDEKPHGSVKPAATSPEQPRVAATGGRHDSGVTTHGMKKRAVPRDATASDAAGKEKQ
jgi:hypothetical protein